MTDIPDKLKKQILGFINEENERAKERINKQPRKDVVVEGEPVVIDDNDIEQLKCLAPHRLKDKAKEEVVVLCRDLVSRGWVTEWEIRNILQSLSLEFSKTKYMPGFDKK